MVRFQLSLNVIELLRGVIQFICSHYTHEIVPTRSTWWNGWNRLCLYARQLSIKIVWTSSPIFWSHTVHHHFRFQKSYALWVILCEWQVIKDFAKFMHTDDNQFCQTQLGNAMSNLFVHRAQAHVTVLESSSLSSLIPINAVRCRRPDCSHYTKTQCPSSTVFYLHQKIRMSATDASVTRLGFRQSKCCQPNISRLTIDWAL